MNILLIGAVLLAIGAIFLIRWSFLTYMTEQPPAYNPNEPVHQLGDEPGDPLPHNPELGEGEVPEHLQGWFK